MTQSLFLDSSGWIAALFNRETRHAEALELYQSILVGGGRLVTTDLVLAETHALSLRKAGRRYAMAFLEHAMSDVSHEIVFTDPDLQATAIDRWLRPFGDQAFSLADAVSFEVMRHRRLRRALTLDRHFLAAGYEIL